MKTCHEVNAAVLFEWQSWVLESALNWLSSVLRAWWSVLLSFAISIFSQVSHHFICWGLQNALQEE